MISDNVKTFKATVKSEQNVDINTILAKLQVEWRFNSSRNPWWGELLERMFGLTKNVLLNSLGRSRLPIEQLKEVLLIVDFILNNRPLGYLEDKSNFLP